MPNVNILIVEDEVLFAMSLRSHVLRLGYDKCDFISSGEEAIEQVDKERPDLVLMDILLDGKINGIEAAKAIRSRHDIPIVFLTGYIDTEILEEMNDIEASTYITKPMRPNDITAVIEKALQIR